MAEKKAKAEPEAPADGATDEPGEEQGVILHERPDSILQPARYGFDPKQVEAIRRTVAKECTDAELVMFLEVCGRYELDPFAKQVFAAKIQGAVQIIVSRDGLLALAHKSDDFRGIIGDVVHENDEFTVSYDEGARNVHHVYSWKSARPEDDAEPGDSTRGAIVGAWAEVRREGHEPTFYFAPLSEYDRGGKTPWSSHKSAMILKVAEQYALRKAFSVSGVVGEDEIDRRSTNLTALPDEPDYGDDALGAELRELVEGAREIDASAWRQAKVRGLLDGADDDARKKLRAELAAFIAEHTNEEEVVDAEVVGADG